MGSIHHKASPPSLARLAGGAETRAFACYARVVFERNTSVAEMHPDVSAAHRWIECERHANPESFRLGQIVGQAPDHEVIATCDANGWHPGRAP